MAVREIGVRLTANVVGLASGLRAGSQAVSKFTNDVNGKIQRSSDSIDQLSRGFGVVGVAAVGAAALALRSFANFDQAMSAVQAATHGSAEEMGLLREAALDAGQRTVYSATESAAAIENLAKAGISTADILGGGLDGALDLAAAGGLEVAEAAEIAASALTQFDLKGQDAAHVSDVLAAGAGKAQGDVRDMGFALRQSGLIANQFGISLEETVGTLSAFASAGMIGSDAGTSFRSMLLHLANPAEETNRLMKELGINAYDLATGEFVGLPDLAQQLSDKLGGLSDAQRDAALAQIFGSDAIRAANILMDEGAAGIESWTEKVDDQGYAAETAGMRLDNLKGDLEQLGGALETAFINAASGSNDFLRTAVQNVTELVQTFNDLPGAVQNVTFGIVGSGGLVALGVAGAGKLATSFSNVKTAVDNLGWSMRRLTLTGGAVGLAIAAAGWALSVFLSDKAEGRRVVEDFTAALEADSGAFGENAAAAAAAELANSGLGDAAEKAGISFEDAARAATGNKEAYDDLIELQNSYGDELDGLMEKLNGTEEGQGSLTDAERERAEQLNNDLIPAIADVIGIVEDQNGKWDEAKEKYDQQKEATDAVNEALEGTEDAAGGAGGAVDDLAGDMDGATTSTEGAEQALKDYQERLKAMTDPVFALNSALKDVEEAQAAYNEVMADGNHTQAEAEQAAFDLASAVAGLEQAALDGDLSFESFDAKLQEWVDSGRITEEQAADIRRRVQDLTGAAEDYKGKYNADIEARDLASQKIKDAQAKADAWDKRKSTAEISAIAYTNDAERKLNLTARDRNSVVYLTYLPNSNSGLRDGYRVAPATGGWIGGPRHPYATGGHVELDLRRGGWNPYGTTATADDVPAMLSRNEFVVRAMYAKRNRGVLEAINRGQIIRGYAEGGPVVPSTIDLGEGSVAKMRDMLVGANRLDGAVLQLQIGSERVFAKIVDRGNKSLEQAGARF